MCVLSTYTIVLHLVSFDVFAFVYASSVSTLEILLLVSYTHTYIVSIEAIFGSFGCIVSAYVCIILYSQTNRHSSRGNCNFSFGYKCRYCVKDVGFSTAISKPPAKHADYADLRTG